MAGVVVVPWYATGFRSNRFAEDLAEVATTALRYGATSYAVYRSQSDKYRFQQFAAFEDKLDWERYWEGPEMTYFRTVHSSWYQVPVLYDWWDVAAAGATDESELVGGNGRGNGNGNGHGRVVGDIT